MTLIFRKPAGTSPSGARPSRADALRQRREQSAGRGAGREAGSEAGRKPRAAGRGAGRAAGTTRASKAPKVYSAASVPVFSRHGRAAVPARTRRAGQTRRRVDIALGKHGGELRLPAFPVLRVTWQAVSGSLAVLLAVLLWTFWNGAAYRVQAATVNGLQRIGEREVNLVLNVQNLPVFALDPAKLRADLQAAFPEFEDVSVLIGMPNQVTVSVAERQPVLLWRNGGKEVLLDAAGYAFPVRGDVADLPVLEAETLPRPLAVASLEAAEPQAEPQSEAAAVSMREMALNSSWGQMATPEIVAAARAMLAYIPAGAPVVYDAVHGLGWQDPGGWQVYFGLTGGQMAERLNVYQALVAYFAEHELQPAFVSVEHLSAPYYRLGDAGE